MGTLAGIDLTRYLDVLIYYVKIPVTEVGHVEEYSSAPPAGGTKGEQVVIDDLVLFCDGLLSADPRFVFDELSVYASFKYISSKPGESPSIYIIFMLKHFLVNVCLFEMKRNKGDRIVSGWIKMNSGQTCNVLCVANVHSTQTTRG